MKKSVIYLLLAVLTFSTSAFASDVQPPTAESLQIVGTLYNGLALAKVMEPQFNFDEWMKYFKKNGFDPHSVRLDKIRFKGNLFYIRGISGSFAVLDEGRIEHDGQAFKAEIAASPESNLERMKKVWHLNAPRRYGLSHVLLPEAHATDQMTRNALMEVVLSVATIVAAANGLRVMYPLLWLAVGYGAWNLLQSFGSTCLKFTCDKGFSCRGDNVTDRFFKSLPSNPKSDLNKELGTPSENLKSWLQSSCSKSPKETEASMKTLIQGLREFAPKLDQLTKLYFTAPTDHQSPSDPKVQK